MIDPVTGAALGEALGAVTGQMAGQSLADAYNQRMSDTYTDASGIEIGVGTYTDVKPSISGDTSNTVVDSQESDPSVAFEHYETAGGVVDSTTGGFIYGSNVGTYSYSLLEDDQGNVKAVAPVSVPVETAYVAISQALGLSMKVSEVDPVLADKFARGIIAAGCVYDAAKGLVTAWWDGVNILFPKSAIDAVHQTIEDEGIPEYDQETTPEVDRHEYLGGHVDSITFGGRYYTTGQSQEWTANGCVFLVKSVTSRSDYIAIATEAVSREPSTYIEKNIYPSSVPPDIVHNVNVRGTLHDGSEYYQGGGFTLTVNPSASNLAGYTPDVSSVSPASIPNGYSLADVYFLGESTTPVVPSEYPQGMWRSLAEQAYTPTTMPVAGGIAHKIDGGAGIDTIEVCPIRIDEDSLSGDTSGSTVDPITANPDPDINEELPPAPIPAPIPDTNVSNPDVPLVDSSVVNSTLINELVEELANTLDPQPEQSSGMIPFPWMPGSPVIDPDTGEQTGTQYPSIVPASGSGLIHVYNPTPGEFVGFGNWLWVTYADATIDKIWNNPFDGIIGAHELYATPQRDGRDNIRSGFLVCPVTSDLVRQRYTEIDCGTVIVPEFYGNYFDYSPYSQAYIYLPFIGINEVSIDDIVGHAVNIRYRVDAYNGSCIAMIYVAKSGYRNLCYQFAGNCAVEVPLAGGSQAAIKAGMLQAEAYSRAAIQSAQIQKTASIGSGILGGAAGSSFAGPLAGIIGALAGGTSGYIQGSANVAAAKLQGQAMQEAARYANKSSVQHSGQFGASHGAMGLKTPFIMIRNPIQVKVVNYNDDYGFPAHKRVIIGGCTGYLRVREVNVISAHATNEEKRAIEEELKAGVYVS
jgi:hypothetical protein